MTDPSLRRCVIVGASHAGVQAALRLRQLGWAGPITLIGEESRVPYHRPPLSKDYLTGAKSMDKILLRPEAAYERAGVERLLGVRVQRIDRDNRRVEIESGAPVGYDKLVLAVGSRPRQLPVPGTELEGVGYLRDAGDVDRIRSAVDEARRAVVIGGGYIGLEVAASLRKLGLRVTVLEALDRVLQRVTGPAMSDFFTRVHGEEGVQVRLGAQARAIVGNDRVRAVELASGETIEADLVVIGIGIIPNTELAERAGLNTGDGIEVDEFTRTSDPDIHAAGDCACMNHPGYARRVRLECVQNANDQAQAVANVISGNETPYEAVPWFWSDQYDVKLQIAGLAAGADQVIARGDPTAGRGFSLCYLKDRTLLAVDAVNRARDFLMGKKLIVARSPLDPERVADPEIPLVDASLAAGSPG